MIRSILIGAAAGARSLTPLAVVSEAARQGRLPNAPSWLGEGPGGAIVKAAAAAELWGDKLRLAPDRTMAPSMLVRMTTAAVAGAAVAPREAVRLGAVLGAAAALVSTYATFHLRQRAMSRFGQRLSGLAEDTLVAGLSYMAVFSLRRSR